MVPRFTGTLMVKQLSELSLSELWELFPIILKPHNPDYALWYEQEKQSLLKLLGSNNIARINHIGSTAIPNLIAKPTIDILLEINNTLLLAELKELLFTDSWLLMSEDSEDNRKPVFCKGYTASGFADKIFHLHIRPLGDWDELYFRDLLLEDEDVRVAYQNSKLELLPKFKNNRDGYTQAKTDFIYNSTKLARQKYLNRY